MNIIGTSTCDVMIAEHEEIGDNLIKGICGLVDAALRIFRALVEATAYGLRAIVERFRREGLKYTTTGQIPGVK